MPVKRSPLISDEFVPVGCKGAEDKTHLTGGNR